MRNTILLGKCLPCGLLILAYFELSESIPLNWKPFQQKADSKYKGHIYPPAVMVLPYYGNSKLTKLKYRDKG